MSDRVLTWHIAGVLSDNVEGTNVSTEFTADDNYVPVRVLLRQKSAQAGVNNIIDINDDGVSIFSTIKPALTQGILSTDWRVFNSSLTYIEEDSVITLDVDQVSGTTPGSDLTVQLELNKA